MTSFKLYDRVKETSRSTGTSPFILDGAAQGFSAFSDFYSDGDYFYYAITDGTNYEVGSGQYVIDGSHDTIVRFPFQSTNSNSAVNFGDGVKEVFVTYAGKSSVYSALDLENRTAPNKSGVLFWGSDQIAEYDSDLVWDSGIKSLGLQQTSPTYAVDVGGFIDYSVIRASGFIDGGSGILFSGVTGSFSGGRQLEPFLRSQLNNDTGTDAVFALSGLVNEHLLFEKQVPKVFLAGPTEDCGCVSDYPTFRMLELEDLPLAEIDDNYVKQHNIGLDGTSINTGAVSFRTGSPALYSASGYITYDSGIFFDTTQNRLLVGGDSSLQSPTETLEVVGDTKTNNIKTQKVIFQNSGNVIAGENIAYQVVDFSESVAIGSGTAYEASGEKNVYMGYQAGASLSGNYNIEIVSSGAGLLGTDNNNKLNIGNIIFGDLSSGVVAIGQASGASPGGTLHLLPSGSEYISLLVDLEEGGSTSGDLFHFRRNGVILNVNASGDLYTSGNVSPKEGLLLQDHIPQDIANKLYQDNGNLYWGADLVDTAGAYQFLTTDGLQAGDAIINNQTLIVSGVSGVDVRYDANDNFFRIGASGLSGVLQGQIDDFVATNYSFYMATSGDGGTNGATKEILDKSYLVVSGVSGINVQFSNLYDGTNDSGVFILGWDATSTYSFNVTNGDFLDDTILSSETITISGVSGIRAEYDASNNFFRIGGSGLISDIEHVSGVAYYASGQVDQLNVPNATSGITKENNHLILDHEGSGVLKRLGMNDKESVIVGISGCHGTTLYDSGVFIGTEVGSDASNVPYGVFVGYRAGYDALNSKCAVNIGYLAGMNASGMINSVSIGCEASLNTADSDRSISIGNQTMGYSSGVGDSIFIGNRAGLYASGTDSALFTHDNISIGNRSNESAYQNFDNNISIGHLASRYATYNASGVVIGQASNVSGSGNEYFTYIGYSAGNKSKENSEAIYIGNSAGFISEKTQGSIGMGPGALYAASGTLGQTLEDVIGIGRLAGWKTYDSNQMIAIGRFAGILTRDTANSIYIGAIAGSGRRSEGDIIFSNTSSYPVRYQPQTGAGNGKNGIWWTDDDDSILELSTAFQGYINDLEDDDNRDVRFHIGHPLYSSNQLKSTLQLQRTSADDYHLFLENAEEKLTASEEPMAIADSPLKSTSPAEDGIPFIGPSGLLDVPFATYGGGELVLNGKNVPKRTGTVVGYLLVDGGLQEVGLAVGFFDGGNPLGLPTGWYKGDGTRL